jgi:hypothetical protein
VSRLLREPLVAFGLLGALLFVVHARVASRPGAAPDRIVVGRAQIANLAGTFEATWQRPPTPEELEGLIEDWIRDEVLYREGVALGVDQGDTVVRRRIRQKMELLGEEVAATDPTDADLQAWLDAHRTDYDGGPEYTFRQVYFDPSRRGAALAEDVERTMQVLDGTAEPSGLGDPTLLPPGMESAFATDVERTFGREFASALADLPVGAWRGPVRSSYGVHLVRVSNRTEARVAMLAGVRDAVLRDWQRARVKASVDAWYRRLRTAYEVVVERPAGD